MRTRLMPDVDCNWKGCRVRLAVTTGSPSYFSESPYLWSQPRGLSRTGQLLDDQEIHSVGGVRAELLLSAALALIVAGFSTYLSLG